MLVRYLAKGSIVIDFLFYLFYNYRSAIWLGGGLAKDRYLFCLGFLFQILVLFSLQCNCTSMFYVFFFSILVLLNVVIFAYRFASRLGHIVMRDESVAFISAILYTINPASIFMSPV